MHASYQVASTAKSEADEQDALGSCVICAMVTVAWTVCTLDLHSESQWYKASIEENWIVASVPGANRACSSHCLVVFGRVSGNGRQGASPYADLTDTEKEITLRNLFFNADGLGVAW